MKKIPQLLFDFPQAEARIIICRPTDIPIYVEYGAAHIGFVGKDTLVELNRDVAELVDLKFGYCRFVVAMPEETKPPLLADGTYDLVCSTIREPPPNSRGSLNCFQRAGDAGYTDQTARQY